ncbi:hypothetical protein [Desulfatibacillum aliphaticivorans]|uniref:hypothetical protein n=1 Tax=Desulfatibacillum aliphaticivorans TaxID=218208 RepID=UPI0004808A02|nr:hypothetical protein [Desulfatibacillum aliphaticivorans]
MNKSLYIKMVMLCVGLSLVALTSHGIASDQGVGHSSTQPEKTVTIKGQFDEAYRNWQIYCDTPDVMYSSLRSTYVENEPFGAIINLGPPALPVIMEKLQKDKDNDWQGGDFLLWYAVKEITGVDLEQWDLFESEPDIAEKYIQWWHENKASWSQGHAQ